MKMQSFAGMSLLSFPKKLVDGMLMAISVSR